jgi:hypothetical protein
MDVPSDDFLPSHLPSSPFAWGVAQRLGVSGVLILLLWLVVAWALDWWAVG